MRFVAITSLILGSAVAWPMTSDWQHLSANAEWFLPRFAGSPSSLRFVTAPIKVEDVVKTVTATGSLIPALNIEVGSVLSGQISKLRVDFNDKVVKGQVLAELDPRSFELAADVARAALEGAKADIGSLEARVERAALDLKQAEAQRPIYAARADSARIAYEMAEREFRRKTWLQDRGAAATADVLDSTSKRDSLAAALREAEATLSNQTGVVDSARVDVKKATADLSSGRATVARLDAQLQSALVDLTRSKVRSPVDGIVLGRNITEGQTLATSLEAKTLFTIAGDLDHMEIDARIDESDIAKIKDGQSATFTVDAFPGRMFSAVVKQIRMSPQTVSNVVTYTVVLTTSNPDRALLPGMTVLAKIVTQKTRASTTVPLAALRYQPKRQLASLKEGEKPAASLWVLDRSGSPRLVPVVVGDDDGTNVIVTSSELRADDRIIIRENKKEAGDSAVPLKVGY